MESAPGLRILYDGLIYRTQVAGGINRYHANLISRLPSSFSPCLVVGESREINFPSHPNLQVYRQRILGPYIVTRSLERLYFDLTTDFTRRRFDVVHPTYYFLLSKRSFNQFRRPIVITVHDMIHELFPQADILGVHAREKRKAVRAAQAIICVSENTRKDLLERYPDLEGKVTVTPLAAGVEIGMSHGPEPTPERPYFFFVGARPAYKNFGDMLVAMSRVVESRPEARLCVVGKPFSHRERRRIAELRLTGKIEHYGTVTDAHLAKLYRCSAALVYPSLYEGFGISPLEAVSCGAPVIASNCSSLPEVVGEAGLLCAPGDVDQIVEAMLRLLDDSTLRQDLIAKGLQRANLFSWERVAARTIEVYRSVLC